MYMYVYTELAWPQKLNLTLQEEVPTTYLAALFTVLYHKVHWPILVCGSPQLIPSLTNNNQLFLSLP